MALRTSVVASAIVGAGAFAPSGMRNNNGQLRSTQASSVQPANLETVEQGIGGKAGAATMGALAVAAGAVAVKASKRANKVARQAAATGLERNRGYRDELDEYKPVKKVLQGQWPAGDGFGQGVSGPFSAEASGAYWRRPDEQALGGKDVEEAVKQAGIEQGKYAEGRQDRGKSGRLIQDPTGVPGICLPITQKFDPLNLSDTPEKLARYTAVEIKHGRIAMIATLGYILPEIFRFPGCENFGNGFAAFNTIPLEGWVQLVGFIGAHELFVKPREGALHSQDFGLGTELLRGVPAGEVERKLTVERNNGRLAMIGILGMMWQDGTFGEAPISFWGKQGWWGPGIDKWVQFMGPGGAASAENYNLVTLGVCLGSPAACAFKPAKKQSRFDPMTALAGGAATIAPKVRADIRGDVSRKVVVYEDPGFIDEMTPKELREPAADEKVEMSPSCPWMPFPQYLKGWVGGEVGFDPLGFGEAMPFGKAGRMYWVREAELKHGRVCMLATLGWIATDCGWRFPGALFQNTDTINAHNDLIKTGLLQPLLASIAVAELYGYYLITEGEACRIMRDPGDYWLGKNFLPEDPEKADEMRLKELKNGRLAMLAFSGIATVSVALGKKWPFFLK